MRLTLFSCCFFLFSHSYSQTSSNQEKINTLLQDYYLYEREVIHVQFNKISFINNEHLAFKGYVLNKNKNEPHQKTTNVQLVIYDAEQNVIQKQLLYTTKGSFAGGIQLNNTFKTGRYYFRFYTNWMNNFREDDTFTQSIEITDLNDTYHLKSQEPNWDTVKVSFFPEGGNIIDGITNSVGVKITDCNPKGIELNNITVVDSKNNEMARFSTNKMGNGFFYFIPYKNEKYSLKILTPELNLTESLPDTKETGIILTYNNQLAENRVAIAIKTNKKGKLLYENKIFTVLIHQNGKAIQKQIGFPTDELESQFVFDKKYLPNGVSSIRLIDENLNEICERLLYHHANTKVSIPLEVKQTVNDSIQLLGKTEFTTTDLSISILPEESVCMPQKSSILGTFFLNAYLESPETDNFSYYDTNNNNRFNEMDLLMLNQNHSKYDWKNIKSNPPQKIYPFDIGVAIRGKVTDVLKPNANFKIALFSLKDNVSDETPLENNGEFAFENFYAKDSTVFLFQMMNTKNNVLKANMVARVNRNEPPCTFNLKTHKNHCLPEKKEEKTIVFTLPKSDNSIINLDEITVKNNYKKEVFVHKSDMSINSTAYKIGDREFGNVLDFISRHGYRIIQDSLNNVSVQSNRRTIPGSDRNPPAVYVDNDLVFDYSYLADVFLVDVDEIYIDQSGFSNTSMRNNGVIKIFLKKDRTPKNYFNTKLSSLLITKGFATCPTFKNTDFASQQAFYNFGTLYWSANFSTTEESKFQIQFPRDNQKAIQVLIEGFLEDGQFISEMKTIPISN